jgi:hypothetical protein
VSVVFKDSNTSAVRGMCDDVKFKGNGNIDCRVPG